MRLGFETFINFSRKRKLSIHPLTHLDFYSFITKSYRTNFYLQAQFQRNTIGDAFRCSGSGERCRDPPPQTSTQTVFDPTLFPLLHSVGLIWRTKHRHAAAPEHSTNNFKTQCFLAHTRLKLVKQVSQCAVTSLPVDSPGAGLALLSGTDAHMDTTQVVHLLRTGTPTHTHTHTQLKSMCSVDLCV